MSAGTAFATASTTRRRPTVHLYQIWAAAGSCRVRPSYEEKTFPEEESGPNRLVVSPDGADGSLTIQQDARVTSRRCTRENRSATKWPGPTRLAASAGGKVRANGTVLETSDGLAVSEETRLTLIGEQAAEVMLFDLA